MSPVDQLTDEVSSIVSALTPFVGVVDDSRLDAFCMAVVAELAGGDVAVEACASVMGVLWPRAQPEDCGRADWWTTPLGRLCARVASDERGVTHATAAAMLGVTRGTVSQMVARGNLARSGDGSVSRASVLTRLAR